MSLLNDRSGPRSPKWQRRFCERLFRGTTTIDWLILLAGGSGQRAGTGENKVYRSLAGSPLLSYPLRAIEVFPHKVGLVVVARAEDRPMLDRLLMGFSDLRPKVVFGGKTRQHSELAGLGATQAGERDFIGIHDGARPFLTADLWESSRAAAADVGGAIPTIDAGPIFRRDNLDLQPLDGIVRAQTPQVFEGPPLVEAYQQAARESDFSGVDTAEIVARFSNLTIGTVAGDRRNLKVTTAADFDLAADLVGQWTPEGWLSV